MFKIKLFLKEFLLRLIQVLVEGSLFDFPPLYQFRNYVYRRSFGAKKGLTVGRNCRLICADFAYAKEPLGKITIGENCAINHSVEIDYSGGIIIGKEVWISQNTLIETHSHLISKGRKESWPIRRTPLVIQNGVWIGANVIVTESVKKIGANAVIGAGAVVTKDVPPRHVVAGVPAKTMIIRKSV